MASSTWDIDIMSLENEAKNMKKSIYSGAAKAFLGASHCSTTQAIMKVSKLY
jgi:hypothetical protein